MYDSSMKYKWDNKNVRDYAIQEAKLQGRLEGKREVALQVASAMKGESYPIAQIARITKLSAEEIEKL
jgi:predicted transposase/invertase (TIGR01784 family)